MAKPGPRARSAVSVRASAAGTQLSGEGRASRCTAPEGEIASASGIGSSPIWARLSSSPDMKELVVISPLNDWTCRECQGSGDLLVMDGAGPLCLACAELDHLVFLSRGDAALTRRAKAASKLWAVVTRFSRSRKRYERQGLLVEEPALRKAEAECLADAEVRARRKAREAEGRAVHDEALARSMADWIRRLFPGCPPEEAEAIARHATVRKSGRVGRTAAAREMEERPLTLAVVAAVRHGHTRYDELLMSGMERSEAVRGEVDRVLAGWR